MYISLYTILPVESFAILRTACADVRYEIHKQTEMLLLHLLLLILPIFPYTYTYAGREHVMALTTSASAGDQSQIKLKHNFWPTPLIPLATYIDGYVRYIG